MTATTTPTTSTLDPWRLRVAGLCALLGTVANIVAGVLHGRLSAGSGVGSSAVIFRHVLDTPSWAVDNLISLLTMFAWLAVFVALGHRVDTRNSGWVGRLAAVTLAIGTALVAVLYLTDAYTIPALAHQWAAASPGEQHQLVATGDLVQRVIRMPLFNVLPTFVLGLPFALYGLAQLHRPGPVPTWTAVVAGITGLAAFVIGLSWIAGSDTVPEIVLWVVIQPLIWVWGIATGIAVLLSSARTATSRSA